MKKIICTKLIVVYGPTASGKTSLAVNLAKKRNGELINADSRQIYKYMDIGTNKESSIGVPIHLVDIVTPDKTFDVASYQKMANEVIDDVVPRKRIPILVGGTGLYIDAVVKGYNVSGVPSDLKLRAELNILNVRQLQQRLKNLNLKKFESMNNSDRNNPRRLVRAIEISKSGVEASRRRQSLSTFDVEWHTPKYTKEELFRHIDQRVIEMVDEGLIEETRKLLDMGYDFSMPVMNTMGYKESGEFLRGEISKQEMIEKIQLAHRQYARRQMTWNRKHIEDLIVS